MLKKVILMGLSTLLLNIAISPFALASGNNEKEAKFAEKVKTEITKLGTGPEAKVKLKLKDGTNIEGYIKDIEADQFVMMNSKTGQTVSVLYPQVKQVKGNNLSTGVAILIGLGVLILLIVIAGNSLK